MVREKWVLVGKEEGFREKFNSFAIETMPYLNLRLETCGHWRKPLSEKNAFRRATRIPPAARKDLLSFEDER